MSGNGDEPFLGGGDDVEEVLEDDGAAGDAEADDGDEMADEIMEELDVSSDEDVDTKDLPDALGPDMSRMIFPGHKDHVYSVAISPNGALAVSGGGDDVAFVWDVATGNALFKLDGHTDSVVAVAFSNSSAMVATGSYDHTVKVWNTATGVLMHTIEGPGDDVEWITWHDTGDVLLLGSADATAWMWHVPAPTADGTVLPAAFMHIFAGHESSVTAGCFARNGKSVVTGSLDGTVRVWNPKSGACAHAFGGHGWHSAPINAIAASKDKPLILTASQDGSLRLANIMTSKVLATMRHTALAAVAGAAEVAGDEEDDEATASVECVAFCDSHPFAASGATDGSLVVWDTGTTVARHRLMHGDCVTRVAFAPRSPVLLATTSDGALFLWDARDGRCISRLTGHRGAITDLAVWSPVSSEAGRSSAVTAGDDGVCRVWDINHT